MRKATKLILFLSSYSPLFVILFIQSPFPAKWVAPAMLAVAVVSVAILVGVLRLGTDLNPESLKVIDASKMDTEAVSYIVTYIFPFMGIDFCSSRVSISMTVVFLVLAILYVNSSLIYINPVLNLLGYHIYEVRSEGAPVVLITKRRRIPAELIVRACSLDGDIYLEVERK